MEDFHSCSVLMGHSVARNNAWCPSDSHTQNIWSIGMEVEEWPPEDGSDNHAALHIVAIFLPSTVLPLQDQLV